MAGPGMLSLTRTQKYCTKLADEMMKLRGEKALMDFKISIRDDTIPCSKFVMAAQSPMLRAMLTSDMAEVAKQEMRLDHIDLEIIQIIIGYMYCEDINFHKDQLMALISAADYLQMTELKEMCLDEVPGILDYSNVISWWKEAVKMNFDDIRDKCEKIMTEQFIHVSQQTDFRKLDLTEMEEYIINICSETVDSDLILSALTQWVSHNEERVPFLQDLLHKVHLDRCSAEGIKAVLSSHEALFDKTLQVYKVLLKALADISTDNSKARIQRLVIIGGREGVNQPNLKCWDVSESNIETLFEVSSEKLRDGASVCQTEQGFAITGGGKKFDLCFVFIASTRSWLKLQNLLTQRSYHGSVCVKGALYVIGGNIGNSDEPSDSVDFMVMEDGDWEEGPALPLAVEFSEATNLDDSIYLLEVKSLQLLCLDIDKRVWNKLAKLPVRGANQGAVHEISLTSAHGMLFAAGGLIRVCAWYSPATDTWCTGEPPLQIHNYGALAYHNRKLVLLGGHDEVDGTDEVEEYNIEENKWSMCTYKIPKKILFLHAVLLDMQP